jgi:hypothetical protein
MSKPEHEGFEYDKGGDDSGHVTSAGKLHPQVTSAIDNFGN